MVARYLSNGEPDTSFSEGIEVLDPYLTTRASVALQPDGKIIVVETSGHRSTNGIITRLNPANGSRDDTFGDGGQKELELSDPASGSSRSTTLSTVTIGPDGDIIVAGNAEAFVNGAPTPQAVVSRLTRNGTLDTTYGTGGRTITGLGALTSSLLALARQPDGRLVALGYTDANSMVIARFDVGGHLDSIFHNNGYNMMGFPLALIGGAALTLQANGGIIGAAGTSSTTDGDAYLVRLDGMFGSRDTDFGNNGIKTLSLINGGVDYITALAQQSDGKFVIAGSAQISGSANAFVARVSTDGRLDRSFGDGIVAPITGAIFATFQALALDVDGRIIATGYRTNAQDELLLCRLWP
jgi:uncharacterized delta-60 repeat protein